MDEVACITCSSSSDAAKQPRLFAIQQQGQAAPQYINSLSEYWETLQYPLYYPDGKPAWSPTSTVTRNAANKQLSIMNWFRVLLLTMVLLSYSSHNFSFSSYYYYLMYDSTTLMIHFIAQDLFALEDFYRIGLLICFLEWKIND